MINEQQNGYYVNNDIKWLGAAQGETMKYCVFRKTHKGDTSLCLLGNFPDGQGLWAPWSRQLSIEFTKHSLLINQFFLFDKKGNLKEIEAFHKTLPAIPV